MSKAFRLMFYSPREAFLAQWSLLETLRKIPTDQLGRRQPNDAKSRLSFGCWTHRFRALKLLQELSLVVFHGIPNRLQDLAEPLAALYRTTGDTVYLEQAIRLLQLAAGLIRKENEPVGLYLSDCLNRLGNLFASLYSATRALSDLDEAIRLGREAIELAVNDDDEIRALFLYNVACHISIRYSRSGSIAELNEAIELATTAVALTSEDSSEKLPSRLVTLGDTLLDRFLICRDETDLEQAKQLFQQAVDCSERDNVARADALTNLARIYEVKYDENKIVADLETAIQLTKQALDTIPKLESLKDSNARARTLTYLAELLDEMYLVDGCVDGLKHIAPSLQSALHMSKRSNMYRVKSGIKALRAYILTEDWSRALESSEATMGLFMRLTPRSLQNEDRQSVLAYFSGFVSNAAAIALQTNQGPFIALIILEQGRGVIGANLLEMQTDLTKLQKSYPKLAEKFTKLRDQLDAFSIDGPAVSVGDNAKRPWRLPARRRHYMAGSLDKLINKIRQKPGFEDFMLQPTVKDMQAAAKDGPIVVINMSDFRSDAILIERHQLRSLPLPQLNSQELKARLRDLYQWSQFLAWLWDTVTFPILQSLGLNDAPSDPNNLPRMWWIPIGALGKIPLHAAGRHLDNSAATVMDKVVSSYSASVRAIIDNRRRPARTPKALDEAVIVAMKHTPGLSPLNHAVDEASEIRDICRTLNLRTVEPLPHKSCVLDSLQSCKVFHFAGHSNADNLNPLQSYLVLEDWKTSRLAVADLLQINLRKNAPFLAYLSACGTAQVYEDMHLDESMHLINATQLAGFRHAIGTLWQVRDMVCTALARATYESMRADNMTDKSVSRGLHKATRMLRDDWVRDIMSTGSERSSSYRMVARVLRRDKSLQQPERDVISAEEEVDPALWVPYVHFGV
jgi:tetratricopeptide (TPR) repeat protein